jgi:hypothetical protein
MRSRAFFNLELHGIDLADADADELPVELVQRQPDLRRSLAEKRSALADVLQRLSEDYRFAPLIEVSGAYPQ